MLPTMAAITTHFPDHEFVVAAAPSQELQLYNSLLGEKPVSVLEEKTHEILRLAKAALVTSGTATLETALFQVPEVVCYKANSISYQIAKRLVKVNYISLVNLIMEKEVVKELIQDEYNKSNLKRELSYILNDEKALLIKEEFRQLRSKLGGAGASEKAAREVLNFLKVC